MIGLKYNKDNMQHILNKSRSLVSGAYKSATNLLGNVDYSVQAFKNIYGAVAPVLRNAQNPQIRSLDNYVTCGLTEYDNLWDKVTSAHTAFYATFVIHKWDINLKKHLSCN